MMIMSEMLNMHGVFQYLITSVLETFNQEDLENYLAATDSALLSDLFSKEEKDELRKTHQLIEMMLALTKEN